MRAPACAIRGTRGRKKKNEKHTSTIKYRHIDLFELNDFRGWVIQSGGGASVHKQQGRKVGDKGRAGGNNQGGKNAVAIKGHTRDK